MKIESAVFELSAALPSQLPPDTLPEVALAGRSNVGKSSLINRLLRRKALARTSATPGKTATINFYHLDTLRLVDLPGYGYAKVSAGEKRRYSALIDGYLGADRDLRLVLQLIDMRHPPSADDRRMVENLVEGQFPFVLVLTKADKLGPTERARRLADMQAVFAAYEGLRMIPFSAVTGEGREELLAVIAAVCEAD